jgi:hypothetical protein
MVDACEHESDFAAAAVSLRYDGGCTVAIGCMHCDEHAFADLSPEHFKWNPPDDAA